MVELTGILYQKDFYTKATVCDVYKLIGHHFIDAELVRIQPRGGKISEAQIFNHQRNTSP